MEAAGAGASWAGGAGSAGACCAGALFVDFVCVWRTCAILLAEGAGVGTPAEEGEVAGEDKGVVSAITIFLLAIKPLIWKPAKIPRYTTKRNVIKKVVSEARCFIYLH